MTKDPGARSADMPGQPRVVAGTSQWGVRGHSFQWFTFEMGDNEGTVSTAPATAQLPRHYRPPIQTEQLRSGAGS